MKAITVEPLQRESARVEDVPEPDPRNGSVLVEAIAVGVCGTDVEIVEGKYGWAPRGETRLVLGHESLGRVVDPGTSGAFQKGDLVVGIVRRPDPVPCPNCAVGEWDMCRNGLYTERGIKGRDGYCSERYRIRPGFAVKLDPALERGGVLLEPASVLAKAWEHIERIGERARWGPRRVLITGAGPVGLMGALMGMQRALEVHVLDRNKSGPKPALVEELGATYHTKFPPLEFDVVIECTGAPGVIVQAVSAAAPGGIVCLTGLGGAQHAASLDVAKLNQSLVLENRVVFGSVNANLRHYHAAADALAGAKRSWLDAVITRRVPLDHWHEAYERREGDVKTVLLFED